MFVPSIPSTSVPVDLALSTGLGSRDAPGDPTRIWQDSALFSLVFSLFFFGTISYQVTVYKSLFPGDRKLLKFWVYGLWMLIAAGTACDIYDCWVIIQGLDFYFAHATHVSVAASIVSSIVEVLVQFYFIRGIWRVRKNIHQNSLLAAPLCGTYVTAACTAVAIWIYSTTTIDRTNADHIQKSLTIKIAISIVLDFCVTFDLLVLLRSNMHEFPTYKRRPNNLVESLMVYLVSRGAALLATEIAALVLTYSVDLVSGIIITTNCLPKVYMWSMMVVILNRAAPGAPLHSSNSSRAHTNSRPRVDTLVIRNGNVDTHTFEEHPLGSVVHGDPGYNKSKSPSISKKPYGTDEYDPETLPSAQ